MNQRYALFFDINGTLVSFKTHEIPPSTILALTQAKANGSRVYIATGRPPIIITNLGARYNRGTVLLLDWTQKSQPYLRPGNIRKDFDNESLFPIFLKKRLKRSGFREKLI